MARPRSEERRFQRAQGLGRGVLGMLRRRVARRTTLFDEAEGRPGLVTTVVLGLLPGPVLDRVEIRRRDLGMILRQLGGRSSPTVMKAHPRLPAPATRRAPDPTLNGHPRPTSADANGAASYLPPGPDRLQPSSRPPSPRPSTVPPSVRLDPDAPELETVDGPSPLAERELRVVKFVRETPDAVSLVLEDVSGRPLDYQPGQFLTFSVEVDGVTLRRPYSFSTSPFDGRDPAVTVKRIPDGRVSTHLVERVGEGDVLHATGPAGAFTAPPTPRRKRHLVMLAGGSGITPIMSILRAILVAEPSSRVTLVYGNRGERDIIFRYALDSLAFKHGDRLVVDHVLTNPSPDWAGATGLLDRKTVMARLRTLAVEDDGDTEYYLCGPEPMLAGCREALERRQVPADRVFEERYVQPGVTGEPPPGRSDRAHKMRITRGGAQKLVAVTPGQSLLAAGVAAGVEMPFSCTMGGCGACRVRLVAGEVDLAEPNCLRADEREDGYVLACSAYPKTPVAIEVPG